MALQLVTGVSGSGKSRFVYEMATEIAKRDINRQVFVLVPEQYSLVATKLLTDMNDCIMNIDVLSMRRLAYRAMEEYEGRKRTILGDEGKIMLLRKVIAENKKELKYFKKGIDRPGFLDECKSLLSEFAEYGVGDDEFDDLMELFGRDSRSAMKLEDLNLIYSAMRERMGDTYMLAEDLISQLTDMVPDLSFLKGATICMDEFTGFTPIQYGLIAALLKNSEKYGTDVIVTVTTDNKPINGKNADLSARADVFSLSDNTIKRLVKTANENGVRIKDEIHVGSGNSKTSYRTADNSALDFLDRHIFSYDGEVYGNQSDDRTGCPIEIRVCRSEREEAVFAARESARLIREGMLPEQIAVVTGDLTRYAPHLRRAFESMRLPHFIDDNASLGANPLANFIMSFLDMVRSGFGMNQVMRFLRTPLSPLDRSDVDKFENYIVAAGRRGYNSFKNTWTYKPNKYMSDEDLVDINSYRETFLSNIEETADALRGSKKTIREYAEILCEFIIKSK
ncbi:MAG: exodeoxyribonuclease V subunit gamma, partial [Eubacterium sp.]|nr:exodeoxyribonuclease V subunit gamma [Eubacterium sp.]